MHPISPLHYLGKNEAPNSFPTYISVAELANYFYLKNSLWRMTVNHYGMALTPAKQKFYPTQQKKKQYNSTAGIHLCGLR